MSDQFLLLGAGYNFGGGVSFPSLSVPISHHWKADEGVTITGSGVSSWVDSVGGEDLVQTTDARRPTVAGDYLDFDGVDDNLNLAGGPGLAQPYSVVAFFKGWAPGAAVQKDLLRSNTGVTILYADNLDNIRMFASSGIDTTHDLADANAHGLVAVYNGASSLAFLDALAGSTISPGATGLGTTLFAGAQSNTGVNAWPGDLAELVVLSGAANQADADALQAYGNARYGI